MGEDNQAPAVVQIPSADASERKSTATPLHLSLSDEQREILLSSPHAVPVMSFSLDDVTLDGVPYRVVGFHAGFDHMTGEQRLMLAFRKKM